MRVSGKTIGVSVGRCKRATMECTGLCSVNTGTCAPFDVTVSEICVEYSVLDVAIEEICAKLALIRRHTSTIRGHVYSNGRTPAPPWWILTQKCERTKKINARGGMYGCVQEGPEVGAKNTPRLRPGTHPICSPPFKILSFLQDFVQHDCEGCGFPLSCARQAAAAKCAEVGVVALRVPAHAPWLAGRSVVHRVTRMTFHAPVRTGGAVGAGWDLD